MAAQGAAWVPAATQAAGQAGVGIVDNLWKRKGAKEQNAWNERQAHEQRDYNTRMWQLQTLYNHPQQQMARLKQAGLNPRLMYGSSGSTAMGNAGDVKGYDRAEARNVNEGFDAFSQMYRFHNLKAQTDNLEAQTKVADQEAIKKSLESVDIAIGSKRKSFDLGLAKELRDSSIMAAEQNARKMFFDSSKAEFDMLRSGYETHILEHTRDFRIGKLENEFKRSAAQLKGDQLVNLIRKYEVILNKEGIQKADNLMFRWLQQMFHRQNASFKMPEFLYKSNIK